MFEQIIALVNNKLGIEQENAPEYNEELLKLELEALSAVHGSILEQEIDPEADAVDVIRSSPNVLFFKDEEAPFLDAAIQSKKLIDHLIAINVPQNNGFDLGSMFGGMVPNAEEQPVEEQPIDPELTTDDPVDAIEVEPVETTEDSGSEE